MTGKESYGLSLRKTVLGQCLLATPTLSLRRREEGGPAIKACARQRSIPGRGALLLDGEGCGVRFFLPPSRLEH